ncbi:MAG TPA: FHA domain-containing protein [Polyangiaceae bacterium]|nr:FHA domain-containing protein [Polyangiaceae bacterium]
MSIMQTARVQTESALGSNCAPQTSAASQPNVWLELRHRGQMLVFELTDGGRPLMIGSGWCSDVRLDGIGVALVHVQIYLENGTLWLAPHSAAHVRLNAAHVGRLRALASHSVIEFLSYEIEIWVHDRVPHPVTGLASVDAHTERAPETLRGFAAPEHDPLEAGYTPVAVVAHTIQNIEPRTEAPCATPVPIRTHAIELHGTNMVSWLPIVPMRCMLAALSD